MTLQRVPVVCREVSGAYRPGVGWTTATPGLVLVLTRSSLTGVAAWSIVHEPSGARVGASVDAEAAQYVAALLGSLTDWTAPEADVLAAVDQREIAATLGPAIDTMDRRVPVG